MGSGPAPLSGNAKAFIVPTVILACGVVLLWFSYVWFLSGQSKVLATQSAELARIQGKLNRYNNFEAFLRTMLTMRDSVMAVIARGRDFQELQPGRLENVSEIFRRKDIQIDTMAPAQNGERQGWVVRFKAGFDQFMSLVVEMEKVFRVERVVIAESERPPYPIEVLLVPFEAVVPSPSANVSPAPNEEFFDLYDRVVKQAGVTAKQIQAMEPDLRKGRDIFLLSGIFPRERAAAQAAGSSPNTDGLSIGGIVWDPVSPVVVINDRTLREGDQIGGATIMKINSADIVISIGQKIIVLKPSQKESQ